MAEQVVTPRIRGFIAVNAHPEGCAAQVRGQVATAQKALPGTGLGNALVVGSSTGYGLASALTACFGLGARTLGVCFERPSTETRTASAGWYNVVEAQRLAREQGRVLETINGDAFSHEVKREALEALRERFGPLELLIYSLAAPRRSDPDSDTVWESVIKPIGAPQTARSVDLRHGEVADHTIEAATPEEVDASVRVMGGDDWAAWVHALREADLLAPGFRTVAYSYMGPELTRAVYRDGTIGRAKQHLEATAHDLMAVLRDHCGGQAFVSVNKAVVTQASAAIPSVTLYLAILLRVMAARGTNEGVIDQVVRLFRDHLAPDASPALDSEGRIRLDDLELDPDVQAEVAAIWERVTTENLREVSDYTGYRRTFEQLFGFSVEGIDYDAPTEIHRTLG